MNRPYQLRLYYYPADGMQDMSLLEVVAYRLSSPTTVIDEPSHMQILERSQASIVESMYILMNLTTSP